MSPRSQHEKLPFPFRALILRSMGSVIRNHLQDLGKSTAGGIVGLAVQEMTKSKDWIPEWQEAAGDVLVEIGKKFLNLVMEEILGKFQPGIVPHPCVLRTFGKLSTANEKFWANSGQIPAWNCSPSLRAQNLRKAQHGQR
ncbi:PREDICTED: maestro heat-like repeat-containing protein family member 1 [Sturnus vulgaris]|uniref:maestro heat-like repeat-containing protein family member 1 n=1 Tax=Sturnus vulgaris TaxID=9172 RepID=UPI000719F009|nr:PREDICTED: maestro heat-like repeat-containing protein family member 1 [Sturnus vulgaris]